MDHLKPTKILLELIAFLAILLLGALAWMIVRDQYGHGDQAYQQDRRDRHRLMCFQHVDPGATVFMGRPVSSLSAEEQDLYRIALQRETRRQAAQPTDFLGKVELFFLCASLRKLGLGGVEITSGQPVGVDSEIAALQIAQERVQDTLSELTRSAANSETAEMLKQTIDQLGDEAETLRDRQAGGAQPPPPPVDQPAIVPGTDTWLLVVGADKSDAAAVDQVRATDALLGGTAALADAPAAELRLLGSWRRTVVPFSDEASAREAYELLKDRLPYGGYLRAQSQWCPDLAAADPVQGVPAMHCSD